MLLVSWVR